MGIKTCKPIKIKLLAATIGHFPLNQKFRKFPFLGKFPENPEIVEFSKSVPFNQKFRKFREESLMEQKFRVRNFLNFAIPRKFAHFSQNYENTVAFAMDIF